MKRSILLPIFLAGCAHAPTEVDPSAMAVRVPGNGPTVYSVTVEDHLYVVSSQGGIAHAANCRCLAGREVRPFVSNGEDKK